jgi:hypothetical protein
VCACELTSTWPLVHHLSSKSHHPPHTHTVTTHTDTTTGTDADADEEETVLPAGAVIGFAESLLPNHTLRRSYTAASFVHLLYFDRAAVLAEAERRPQLMRSLWWLVAAQVCGRGGGWMCVSR